MRTVAVLGEGAWGSAVATVLANNGHRVNLWCHTSDVAQEIELKRINTRYFKGIEFHPNIIPSTTIEDVCKNVSIIFVTTPVQYVRSVLTSVKPFVNDHRFVMLCKGIEDKTFLFPSQIVQDVIGTTIPVAVVTGPSFAKEVAEYKLTGLMVASKNELFLCEITKVLQSNHVRLYQSQDVIGVQICSALKNVAALATGMLVGGKYGDNTRAFFLTQFLKEMSQLVTYYGGSLDTVYSLAGVGDLMLTAYGPASKNFQVGTFLAQGQCLEEILKKTGYIPEGVNTAHAIYELSGRKKNDMPLCRALYEVVNKPQLGLGHIIERIIAS